MSPGTILEIIYRINHNLWLMSVTPEMDHHYYMLYVNSFLKDFIFYLFVTMLVVFLYINISSLWVDIGFAKPQLVVLEFPLLIFLMAILYFGRLRNQVYIYLLPTVPVIAAYLGFDAFYNIFGRAPRPSDLSTISEIFLFSPLLGTGVVLFLSVIPLSILFLLFHAAKSYPRREFSRLLIYKIAALTAFALFATTEPYQRLHERFFVYTSFSQKATIRQNGRFNSFVHYLGRETQNRKKLLEYASSDLDIMEILYPGELIEKRNVHLVVMESFIDPRLFKGIDFNRSPLADELRLLIGENDFSHVYSPLYGGLTAQPEFELLSGIKAYAKVETVEFNVMNGGRINGFLKKLSDNSYHPQATIATGFGFFNSKQAYKSLGMTDVVYLGNTNVKRTGDKWLFDGDLFDYNLKRIEKLMNNQEEPFFSYLLGMYGHAPYKRNIALRPDVIETNFDEENESIRRIANQFYYRTKTLGEYLEKLWAMDPDSIIYVTSDHLPAILDSNTHYTKDRHVNIALLFDRGNIVDVSGKHYYEIPWLIWDMLTQRKNQRNIRIQGAATDIKPAAISIKRRNIFPLATADENCCPQPPHSVGGNLPVIGMEALYYRTLYESQ